MKRWSFSVSIVAVLLLLGVLISVQIKNHNTIQQQELAAGRDLVRLQEEAMDLVRENNALAESNRKLSDILEAMRENIVGGDEALKAMIDERNRAEAFAGLTDLEGPGIQIVINSDESGYVRGSSLLLIINELRTSSALAISINDERVVALTEIRDTGSDKPEIVINGNGYPASISYTIKALYAPGDINRGMQLLTELLSLLSGNDPTYAATINEMSQLLIPKLASDSLGNR